MARVTYVKSARASKKRRSCYKCGTTINPGDPYKWFANRIGRMSMRKNFCANCRIRPSDQTTSANLQTLYVATEDAEDALATAENPSLEEIAQILRTAAEGVMEASESYTESADNMEDGFGHETYLSEEIREKAQELESFANKLNSTADDIEGMDDPDAETEDILTEYGGEVDDDNKPLDKEEAMEWVDEQRETRREAAIEAANDVLCNCPM